MKTNPNLIIRSGTREDAIAITRLYYEGSGRVLVRHPLKSYLTDYPSAVACLGEEIVGFVYMDEFSPDILRIDNFYVREDMRNKKIGEKLIEEVERQIPGKYKYCIVENSLLYEYYKKDAPKKISAHRFYEKCGYEIIIDTGPTKVLLKKLS